MLSSFPFQWKWQAKYLMLPNTAQIQMPLSKVFYVVAPTKQFMEKGMPLAEFLVCSSSAKGITKFEEVGKLLAVEAEEALYVPYGWTTMPFSVMNGEVKPTDSHHILVQPLLQKTWQAQIPVVVQAESDEWVNEFLKAVVHTSDSWASLNNVFKNFKAKCEADKARVD